MSKLIIYSRRKFRFVHKPIFYNNFFKLNDFFQDYWPFKIIKFDLKKVVYENGGYTSIKEMQKEIKRRNLNRPNTRFRFSPIGIYIMTGTKWDREITHITMEIK